jgi:hypothetical protein
MGDDPVPFFEDVPKDLCDRAGPEWSVVELPLLLPARQAADLEALARRQGPTVAEALRRLIRDFLSGPRADVVKRRFATQDGRPTPAN